MEKIKSAKLRQTLEDLQVALEEFEDIPDAAKVEELRLKTRALLNRLNRQIEDLDL
ncbi:MAG: hypothetical protein ABL958_16545 [Bdellovibrionia bacterium]